MPYSRLADLAWGADGGDPEQLKTHISHIREKLRMPPQATPGIRTVRSIGYRFELDAA